MKSILVCATALSVVVFVSPAFAGTLAADGLLEMRELNLIVLGNMSAGADVEGKTFVGGNLTNANTYGSGRPGQSPLTSTAPTLTVVGNVTGTANINSGISPGGATIGGNLAGMNLNASNATVLVGGSIGSTNGGNGATIKVGGTIGTARVTGTLVEQKLGSNFTNPLVSTLNSEEKTLVTDLKALSTALENLPSTGSYNVSNPSSATFTSADPHKLGYSVIDITAAQYEKAAGFVYNISIPTIINVNCGTVTTCGNMITDSGNSNGPTSVDNDIIWNFEGAAKITFKDNVDGSVLAPYANVITNNNIEGTLAAMGLTQGGELHQFAFKSPLTNAIGAPTPEPATWAMMLTGFGFAGAALRRRRVAVAA